MIHVKLYGMQKFAILQPIYALHVLWNFQTLKKENKKIALLINPDTMKRYFDSGSNLERSLFSRVLIKHKRYFKNVKVFEGERVSDKATKLFDSPQTFLVDGILKTRLETPFRNFQTQHFLELKKSKNTFLINPNTLLDIIPFYIHNVG